MTPRKKLFNNSIKITPLLQIRNLMMVMMRTTMKMMIVVIMMSNEMKV